MFVFKQILPLKITFSQAGLLVTLIVSHLLSFNKQLMSKPEAVSPVVGACRCSENEVMVVEEFVGSRPE